MDTAAEVLAGIPDDQKNKIARFLEGQGYKEMALDVATDPEHRFDLALALHNLPIALAIARAADVEHRWKTVGDAALAAWDLPLAEECFTNAKDLGSLLLVYTSTCNADGLRHLTQQADAAGAHNIAFTCLWQLADLDACIDLLVRTHRLPEAVLFAQTYKPSRAPGLSREWKRSLEGGGKGKVARMLGVPPDEEGEGDAELFPEWKEYLRLEAEGGTGSLVDVEEGGEGADEKGVPVKEVEAVA